MQYRLIIHIIIFHSELKGIVHFEINLAQGHPRCWCLCFRSSLYFDIFRSNHSCLSVI